MAIVFRLHLLECSVVRGLKRLLCFAIPVRLTLLLAPTILALPIVMHLQWAYLQLWVVHSEEVAANIQIARVKMAELVKLHVKALTPSFGDGKQDKCMIEALTQEITALLRSSEKRLQKLSPSGPSEDSNIRKNVQRSHATDLQNHSVDLRKKQSTYLERLRQQNEHGLDLEMNENRSIFDDDALSIFDDDALSNLGTIVDRIDNNIQNDAVSVEEGFKQLQKAERSRRKRGMVRCATVLVIMCLIMPVLLVLKEVLL